MSFVVAAFNEKVMLIFQAAVIMYTADLDMCQFYVLLYLLGTT